MVEVQWTGLCTFELGVLKMVVNVKFRVAVTT